MKNVINLILGILFLVLSNTTSAKEVFIKDPGVTVDIPDSYVVVITKDKIPADFLKSSGMTREEVLAVMSNDKADMYAYSADFRRALLVGHDTKDAYKSTSYLMHKHTAELDKPKFLDMMKQSMEKAGHKNVSNMQSYRHIDEVYLIFNSTMDFNERQYYTTYFTFRGNTSVRFAGYSINPNDTYQVSMLRKMVDTAKYHFDFIDEVPVKQVKQDENSTVKKNVSQTKLANNNVASSNVGVHRERSLSNRIVGKIGAWFIIILVVAIGKLIWNKFNSKK